MKVLQIGCGVMGSAVLANVLKHGDKYNVTIIERNDVKISSSEHVLQNKITLLKTINEIKDVNFDVIIISIKPQNIADIIEDINKIANENTIIVSIMAGISSKYLQKNILHNAGIIRVMPNLGIANGFGASVVLDGPSSTASKQLVGDIFGGKNIVIPVDSDEEVDKITPLTGSGIAYFLLLGKLLKEYAISELKIPETLANENILYLMQNAMEMSKKASFEEGIRQISSKKGITEAAIFAMEKGVKEALFHGIQKGEERAKEIALEYNELKK